MQIPPTCCCIPVPDSLTTFAIQRKTAIRQVQKITLGEGILFSLLWASATVDTKFALRSIEPFLLTFLRFLLVAIILQIYLYVVRKERPPTSREFRSLILLGILNITIYMSGFLIAIQSVSAGIISLVAASNPLFLIFLSSILNKKAPSRMELLGIALCLTGLGLVLVPGLRDNHASFHGIAALIAANAAISIGSIYYSRSHIGLSKTAVNTWQISFGTILFIPIVYLNRANIYWHRDLNFWISFLWLVIPVSIVAYNLWLRLLSKDAVKAGFWLFLSPAVGYALASLILNEKLTVAGILGAFLVVGGLLMSRKRKQRP